MFPRSPGHTAGLRRTPVRHRRAGSHRRRRSGGRCVRTILTADYRSTPRYPKVAVQRDVAIRMSDAVVLKADIYRPADRRGHPIDTKTPTLVNLTPYTKLISALGGGRGRPHTGRPSRSSSTRSI